MPVEILVPQDGSYIKPPSPACPLSLSLSPVCLFVCIPSVFFCVPCKMARLLSFLALVALCLVLVSGEPLRQPLLRKHHPRDAAEDNAVFSLHNLSLKLFHKRAAVADPVPGAAGAEEAARRKVLRRQNTGDIPTPTPTGYGL